MKKTISYIGWGLFAITLIGMIYFAWPKSKTIDFRGYVKEIVSSKEDGYTYIKATMIFSDIKTDVATTIKVEKNTSIKDMDGNKMSVEGIKAGDMIDLDYKGRLANPADIITAKWIRVCPINQQN